MVMRVAVALACVLVSATAGCASRSLASAPAVTPRPALSDQSIPGIGASRPDWDATHTANDANNDGSDYGHDASLPSYLTPNGAVYSGVNDQGSGRIQFYDLNMLPVDGNEMLRRVRRELPADAKVVWDLTFDQCYRLAFTSPTLQAAGDYMADVQLEYIQEDGSRGTGPDMFNHAWIWVDKAGSPPNPESNCSMWTS
jgi:hypothetical protein